MATAIARSTLCHKETTWNQRPRFARLLIKAWTFRGACLVNRFASDGGSELAATAFGKHCGAFCELRSPRPLTVSSPFFSLTSFGSTLSANSINCPSWADSSGIELGPARRYKATFTQCKDACRLPPSVNLGTKTLKHCRCISYVATHGIVYLSEMMRLNSWKGKPFPQGSQKRLATAQLAEIGRHK
jgi:hypothetical protein